MAKNLEMAILLDYYGDMLTDKQRDYLEYYYDEDLSLSEIAENEGITRQGVRDAIKRAEGQLLEMEKRLGHVRRFYELRDALTKIIECAQEISDQNMRVGLSREINDSAVQIQSIATSLFE